MKANYKKFNNGFRSNAPYIRTSLIMSALECALGGMSISIESGVISHRRLPPFPLAGPGVWTGALLVLTGILGVVQALYKSMLVNIVRLTTSVLFTSVTAVTYAAFRSISVYREYVWSIEQIVVFVLISTGVIVNLVHMFYLSREANSVNIDAGDEKSLVST